MKTIKLYITILISIGFISTMGAQEDDYRISVDECFKQADFKDPKYRFKHEHECYIGKKVPYFEIIRLDGYCFDSLDFANKVLVLNFWFTSCPPCIAEMSGLNDISKKYSEEDILFIAASTDSPEELERFLKRKGSFGFDIAANSANLFFETLNIRSGFPTTLVIDQNGIIQHYFSGGYVDFRASKRISKKISSALDELIK